MKFENTQVFNFEGALRGMRNPLESWDRSDSYTDEGFFILGEKDLTLAGKLIKGGTEHRKFLRQIMVSVDITAPLYWWKEFDTYKIGTTSNSTSTMHRLAKSPITRECFEMAKYEEFESLEDLEWTYSIWDATIDTLEALRLAHLDTEKKFYWKELIRLLPSAWLQTRTLTLNYENLYSMYYQRRYHKLQEWHDFCRWVETLPYTQSLFHMGQ